MYMFNIKALQEKVNDCAKAMQSIVETAQAENRALTDEERAEFDQLNKEATTAKEDIARYQQAAQFGLNLDDPTQNNKLTVEQKETRAFENFLSNKLFGAPLQEGTNITRGDNGAVIPTTIVNKIIDKVKDISPLFRDAETYTGKGTIAIPYVDSANDNITAEFADEFTDGDATATKLLTVSLNEHLVRVLSLVSQSLINNASVDIVELVTTKMAEAVAELYEAAILGKKTTNGVDGISTVPANMTVTTKSATAITMDELIDLKSKLKTVFQRGAYFVMSPETWTAIQKLKDGNERYFLNNDVSNDFGDMLFGKPVYTTDFIDGIEAGKTAIAYVNPKKALAKYLSETFELKVLTEKYAEQHAIGFVGWSGFDAKVQNTQAIAVLKIKAA